MSEGVIGTDSKEVQQKHFLLKLCKNCIKGLRGWLRSNSFYLKSLETLSPTLECTEKRPAATVLSWGLHTEMVGHFSFSLLLTHHANTQLAIVTKQLHRWSFSRRCDLDIWNHRGSFLNSQKTGYMTESKGEGEKRQYTNIPNTSTFHIMIDHT